LIVFSLCAGHVLTRIASHNHPPPTTAEISEDRFVSSLRGAARDEFHRSARSIFTEAVANHAVPPGVAYRSVKHALYNEKRRNLPQTPTTRDDIEIGGAWGSTLRGDRFVIPGPDKDMLLFATDLNIRKLATCNLWLMDGTFKCVPTLFGQFYTIHGEIGGYIVPLFFALLPNKQATTYRAMFQRLVSYATILGVQLQPVELLTDCEAAVLTVVKDLWPNASHRICYFHFVQANYRYATENCGLTVPYREDPQVQSLLRRFWALAYLPVISIGLMFSELSAEAASHPMHSVGLLLYVAYFERQWMRNNSVPKKLWNIHHVAAGKRTNNDVEGWNSKWNRAIGKSGPGYYEAIIQLRMQQADTENIFEQVDACVPPPPRRPKVVKKAQRIQSYIDRWMSPPASDVDHNDVIDTARLLRVLAAIGTM